MLEKINTEISELYYNNEESTLYVKIINDVEINLSKIKKHFEFADSLTNNKKHYTLIDASDYFFIEDDALKFLAYSLNNNDKIATAFFSKNLANRLSILYLNLFYKPKTPVRFFTKKDEATSWLKQTPKAVLVQM